MEFQLPVQSPNESIWERFNPRHIALAEKVALQTRKKNDLGSLFANAQMGYTPDDQERIEKEGRLKELTAQFVEQTKNLDDSKYQAAAEQFIQQTGAQYPQRQQAQLQQPNLAQSGFALLAAVLDPSQAAQSVAAPFQFQQIDQQKRQGEFDQQYADQIRQRNENINTAETRMNVEERKLGKAQASQDRQANMTRMLMQDVQRSLDKMDEGTRKAVDEAFTEYRLAKTGGAKEVAGRRLQTILGKSSDPQMRALAPTNDEIAKEATQLNAQGIQTASRILDASIKAKYIDGVVDESDVADFENQANTLARQFGIPREALGTIHTARSLLAQKFGLAQQQFAFLKDKTAKDFKLKWANYQVARQRAATYAQAVANGFALGNVRNQIAAGNLQMRGLEFSTKEMLKSSAGQVKKLADELKNANELAAQNPTDANKNAALKKQIEMETLLQGVVGDLGISPQEAIMDPLGTIQKVIDEMNGQQEAKQIDLGQIDIPSLTGPIGPQGSGGYKKPPRKPARKPQSKTSNVTLPPGWKQ